MNNNVEKKYTRGGKKKRDILKLYDRVVIHTARRSQATQLIEHGTPKKKPLDNQGVNCYLSGPDGTVKQYLIYYKSIIYVFFMKTVETMLNNSIIILLSKQKQEKQNIVG